ncbi:hypothetical protein TRVL_03452 [Trypanosoma vivax]|nr:hypothetical protein TRVL_03452 [Trypanosoma vivax]
MPNASENTKPSPQGASSPGQPAFHGRPPEFHRAPRVRGPGFRSTSPLTSSRSRRASNAARPHVQESIRTTSFALSAGGAAYFLSGSRQPLALSAPVLSGLA